MKNFIYAFIILLFFYGCTNSKSLELYSPLKNNKITFSLNKNKEAVYSVFHKNKEIIKASKLGFNFKNTIPIKGKLKIINSEKYYHNSTWEMPWGEQSKVKNEYNQLYVQLQQTEPPFRKFNIYFKAFNDGIAFRYEFPKQKHDSILVIKDENTEFNLTENSTVWWIPGDWDIYEHLYNTTKFNKINAISKRNNSLAQSYIPYNAVNTPVTMKTESGLYLSFHEANLTNYAGMTLLVDTINLSMKSKLVASDRFHYAAKVSLPFKTPWRTIQIADKATELIDSKLILNLNNENKLGKIDWFKPTKYTGIWWEMHLGKSTWDYKQSQNMNSFNQQETKAKHGATTENAKKLIDFSAQNNIHAMLVEGWNTGWEHWIGFEDREGVFDFVTPYPDYDLKEVVNYAKSKGVEIIMHHETSAAPRTYEKQLDTAYSLMQHLGIHSVKTGYVGKIIPKGEYHHGQWMVNHYRKTIETAAKYQIAVDIHEPIKATGIRRSYPNIISREGLRGQEFNAWSADGGNPPEHLSIIAFTRMLAGPIDYTPGIFNIKLSPYKPNNQVNTTIAQQLALYVVIYSPIQMAADLMENYENQPAFQFIRDVAVDWAETKVLDGEPGDFVCIARKQKNTENWFLGAITDENSRNITISFDFLNKNQKYTALIYKDAENAHWNNNPTALKIDTIEINQTYRSTYKLVEGGGLAMSIMPKE